MQTSAKIIIVLSVIFLCILFLYNYLIYIPKKNKEEVAAQAEEAKVVQANKVAAEQELAREQSIAAIQEERAAKQQERIDLTQRIIDQQKEAEKIALEKLPSGTVLNAAFVLSKFPGYINPRTSQPLTEADITRLSTRANIKLQIMAAMSREILSNNLLMFG